VYEIAIKEGFGFFRGIRQSQDLCFVSGKALHPFIVEKVGNKPGPIIDDNGNRIGTHPGLHFYTIGQRKGIGLPFLHYVKGMDREKNALLVTRDRSRVLGSGMTVEKFNWLAPKQKRPFRCLAQIRSSQPEVPVAVAPKGRLLQIKCLKPVEGITPGQICALYRGKRCIGGGAIK
jgi:tRNA-specific 2-thiouridylase